ESPPSRRGGPTRRGRRAGRFDAWAVEHVDAHPREPATRAGGRAPRRGGAGSRLRSVGIGAPLVARAEDPLELVGRRDLELIVAAVARRLVGAPAHELRRVPEARALHVIVRDLADALGPERLPAQILAAVPAAAGAGHPLSRRGSLV